MNKFTSWLFSAFMLLVCTDAIAMNKKGRKKYQPKQTEAAATKDTKSYAAAAGAVQTVPEVVIDVANLDITQSEEVEEADGWDCDDDAMPGDLFDSATQVNELTQATDALTLDGNDDDAAATVSATALEEALAAQELAEEEALAKQELEEAKTVAKAKAADAFKAITAEGGKTVKVKAMAVLEAGKQPKVKVDEEDTLVSSAVKLKHVNTKVAPTITSVTVSEFKEAPSDEYRVSEPGLIRHWASYGASRAGGLRASYENAAFYALRDAKKPNRAEKQQLVRDLQYAVKAIRQAIEGETPTELTLHTIPAALDAQDKTIHALQTLLSLARIRQLDVDPETLRLSNEVMKVRDGLSKRLASLATQRAHKGLYKNKDARKALKKDLVAQNKDLDLSDDEYDNVGVCSGDQFVTLDWSEAPVLPKGDQ